MKNRGRKHTKRPPQPEAAPKAPTGARLWLFRLAAATAIPLALLLVLELCLRLAGVGFSPHFFREHAIDGQQTVIENEDFGRLFFPESLARHPLPVTLERNKTEDTLRVFVVGGSAAMGDPDPLFGMPRILQIMLEDALPEKKVEVINAAMTGINSNAVLPIARDCLAQDADHLVVYTGNNEVIGPYGPGTAQSFAAFSDSLRLIRASIWVQTTKIGQVMNRLLRPAPANDAASHWGGLRMFADHPITKDDPRLATMRDHLAQNLEDIANAARAHHAEAILCTVGVNLRDFAPLGSTHSAALTDKQKKQCDQRIREGRAALDAGDASKAETAFHEALQIDPAYAEAEYSLAQSFDTQKKFDEAAAHYRRARDLDVLRVRTDSASNEAIQNAATNTGAIMIDTAATLDQSAANGVPGNDLFLDHVHLTFHGNVVLARAIAETIAPDAPLPDEREIARRIAYTPLAAEHIASIMTERLRLPPFDAQSNHATAQAARDASLATLRQSLTDSVVADAVEVARAATTARPNDWMAWEILARNLGAQDNPEEEAAAWKQVLSLIPQDKERLGVLGYALAKSGNRSDALKACRDALEADPRNIAARLGMARLHLDSNDPDTALRLYEQILVGRPDSRDARQGMATILARKGDDKDLQAFLNTIGGGAESSDILFDIGVEMMKSGRAAEAADKFRAAAQADPANPVTFYNLAVALVAAEKHADAAQAYQAAIKLDPRYIDALQNYGALLASGGDAEGALKQFEAARAIDPANYQTRFNIALLKLENGGVPDARQLFAQLLKERPDDPNARYQHARAAEASGDRHSAVKDYAEALRLSPGWTEVQNALAWVLATAPEENLRDGTQAVELARAACKASNDQDPSYLDTLAAAQAEAGDLKTATATARRAETLARDMQWTDFARQIAERAKLYESGKPYHVEQ